MQDNQLKFKKKKKKENLKISTNAIYALNSDPYVPLN